MYTALVITVSDRTASKQREDLSGPEAASLLRNAQFEVSDVVVVPDEVQSISAAIAEGIASDIALIVTTGGTGFSVRDVTPEATLGLLERRADGITELLRTASRASTPFAALSRGVSGITARTLIVNMPGSLNAVRECTESLLTVMPHALRVLREDSIPDSEHSA